MSSADVPPSSPLDDEFVSAEEEEEEELEPTLIKREFHLETDAQKSSQEEDQVQPAEDDRTEDQVPDITGASSTEGNPNQEQDPMTTSVDEIEDLPAADEEESAPGEEEAGEGEEEVAKGDDVPDQLENSQAESGAEIPVDVLDEDVSVEAAPPAEEPAKEEPAAEEPVEEEAVEVVEVPVEEPAAEPEPEPVAEPEPEPEAETEPSAQDEPSSEADDKSFHLQDVPTPKRPRTPNELDAPADEEFEDANEGMIEVPVEGGAPASPVKEAQPATPTVTEPLENGVAAPGSPRKGSNAGSVPATPKTPVSQAEAVPGSPGVRRVSNVSATPKSPMANGSVQPGTPKVENNVGSPAPTTPRSGAIAPSPHTPKSGNKSVKSGEFVFEKSESPPPQPRTPKKTTFEDDVLQVKSPKKAPRSPRGRRTKVSPTPEPETVAEPEPVAVQEEAPPAAEEPMKEIPVEVSEDDQAKVEAPAEEEQAKAEEAPPAEGEEQQEKADVDAPSSPAPVRSRRVQSPSPPRRADREPAARDYVPYDQDTHREDVPPRLPTSTSFSSYSPPQPEAYKPISPWVSTAGKYRNEYTTGVSAVPTTPYTSFFDDLVSSGPFSHSLYSTSRLLERSRSRTRERRSAMRSQRSASNYYRFASQYPAPLRTRDYSTPPSAHISRAPSRAGSFISFLDYAGSKQYDLLRGGSRGSLYDSNLALSRSASRNNIDYYLGSGRVSRVDSYVNNLNSRYEWQVPSNYETYRSASRPHATMAPVNTYASYYNYPATYNDSAYQRQAYQENARELARRYDSVSRSVRNLYEGRVDDLQRSLSRERFARDRLRSKYTQTAYQLEQACKQMDLLRCGSYSSLRSGSQPRTSVYSHFYPYY